MTEDEFRKRVDVKFNSLNLSERMFLMWRCAVIAFPLLGFRRFWPKKDEQKHLYSLLFSLDVSIASINFMDIGMGNTLTQEVIEPVVNASKEIRHDTDGSMHAIVETVEGLAKELIRIKMENGHSSGIRVVESARCALDFDIIERPPNWEEVLIGDLPFPAPKEFYGSVWDDFISALNRAGCAYYAQLYTKIFENQFRLDEESLLQRINVPEEIRVQGTSAVCRHLEEMERRGAKSLDEARIIILGDKGSGKTSLARRLMDPEDEMPRIEESTPGVDRHIWTIKKDEREISVRIWDFAGHTITHAIHRFFLSERCLYIILFDGRHEARSSLEGWLEHVKIYGGNADAIILVNEQDGHKPDIPINLLGDKYNVIHNASFSIRDDIEDLKEFTEYVKGYIADNIMWNKEQIPATDFRVKKALEEEFYGDIEYITKKRFTEIAEAEEIDKEDIEALMRSLHALGISLWYEDIPECKTLILNPEWISNGVYGVVNWAHNKNKAHTLSLKDFEEIFSSDEDRKRFPKEKHRELFELMKNYELAYGTGRGESEKMVIPHILPEDRPKHIPDFPVGESLVLRYSAEPRLPPNVTSRFIVRHHEDIHYRAQVWRYGVVLREEGATALVREDGRFLSVSVKGAKKTEFISKLRDSLNDIFDTYKSEAPELEYRIKGYGELSEENASLVARANSKQGKVPSGKKDDGLWAEEEEIIAYYTNDGHLIDKRTGQKIPLGNTVKIYNIKVNGNLIKPWWENNSVTENTFNFHNCSINLQGSLTNLAASVKKEAPEEAEWLKETVALLQEAENCETPDDAKRKGIPGRLEALMDNLSDPESKLYKVAKKVKNGVKIAQDIGRTYNSIAQWVALPQIPDLFLGNRRG